MATPRGLHGSTARAKSGCTCRACDARRSELYLSTPRGGQATKPKHVYVGKAIVTIAGPSEVIEFGGVKSILRDGEMIFVSVVNVDPLGRSYPRVTGRMTQATWDLVMRDDNMLTECQQVIADVEANMPQAVKKDLSAFQRTKHRRIEPGQDPKAPVDLTVLLGQLTNIVTELASGTMPIGVAMKQYGHLRDEVAARRRQFTEVEGVFEMLQTLIVAKAGIE